MEPASLALAIFPLVVKGIGNLVEATATVKRFKHYHRELKRDARLIQTEWTGFSLSMENLIDNLGHTYEEAQILLKDAGGATWKDPKFQRRLIAYLDSSYGPFVITINDLIEDLEDICEKLDIDSETREVHNPDFFRQSIRRFKHTFNQAAYKEIFDRIRRANDFLRRTVFQNGQLQSWRVQGQSKRKAAGILRFRRQAHTLRTGLLKRERWSCPCRDQHLFNLYLGGLQARVASKAEAVVFEVAIGSADTASGNETSLPSLPSLPRWHMLSVECEENEAVLSHTPTPTARVAFVLPPSSASNAGKGQQSVISDLSSTIHEFRSKNGYLGHLSVSGVYNHGLFRMPWPWDRGRPLETVGQLLEKLQQTQHPQASIFPRRARLLVAAQLSLAVLILGGPWEVKNWTSERLLLIRGAAQTTSSGVCVHEEDALLLPCSLHREGASEVAEARNRTSQVRCAALFALGLTLIELSLGSRFEALSPVHDSSQVETTTSRHKKALDLIPRVEEEDGEAYAHVVERCLDCPFGVRKDLSFENSEFRDFVYENIVQPLQENAAVFQRR